MATLIESAAFFAVAHPKITKQGGWISGGIILVILLAWGWMERELPVTLGPAATFPQVVAGGEVQFDMEANRDTSKNCSFKVTRTLVDSQQQSRVLLLNQEVSYESLKERAAATPGRFKPVIVIPRNVPSGVSRIISDVRWTCKLNITTWVYPIHHTYTWYFAVLPAPIL